MTDTLLAEIVASPDADAPRRVFADRLLEAGDPWGELIHVELDLAAGLPPDARARHTLRQQELRAAHLARMQPAFPDGIDRLEWRRGWIDRIRVTTSCFVSHAAKLFEAAPLLRTIELSDLEPSSESEPQQVCRQVLGRLDAVLAMPEARRLEGLIVPITVTHIEWDEVTKDWDGTPCPSTTQYDPSPQALARILAADLPRLHMLALRRLSSADLDALASSPLGARVDFLRLELFEGADLRRYLDHPNVCGLRGLACDELIEHPKLASLEELQTFKFDDTTLWRLERLRHFVGKPAAGLRPSIDQVTWFEAEHGRPSWSFYPTARRAGD